MRYSLDDLPLIFRPGKLAPTVVLSLVIMLELIFAASFESVERWPVATFLHAGLASTLSFLFMLGACVWGIVRVQRRTDRLVIDGSGVIVALDGKERRYGWSEMARFHLVVVHARTKLHMVAIERQGESDFDPRANVIWPRFGPSADEFLKLLRAGKMRWGNV
jgi:hypothetical protein